MTFDSLSTEQLVELDKNYVWHPYASATELPSMFPVVSATGVRLTLADGSELIDGMSSWWSVLHGYNHPVLNKAVKEQLAKMSHVMFGGLTHPTAIKLCKLLVDLTPSGLTRTFLSDSGSVAVEVALKMALQYWHSTGHPEKHKFISLQSGYHGDTFGAMAVCDPVTGMHHLFAESLPKHHFAEAPQCQFDQACTDSDISDMTRLIKKHHEEVAAVIVEPIVQGAGGMRFYSPEYLQRLKVLCKEYNLLLIFDEIATGFGRTGKLFAMEHADVEPDILCLGKTLTGGYMSLAATLCCNRVSQGLSEGDPGVFMHGPTFMGNALACAVACANIELLISQPWQRVIANMQEQLEKGLAPARELDSVADVRILGGIGVIEMKEVVDMAKIQPMFVERGIWIRPFGKLIYTMPPYITNDEDLAVLTAGMVDTIIAASSL